MFVLLKVNAEQNYAYIAIEKTQ